MVQGTGKSRGGIRRRGLSSLHLSSPKNKGAAQDGSVPLAVVLNYSHGERETRRSAEEGAGRLMANLRWDGFTASVRRLKPGVHGAAETLLMAAREQAALLVMGGYGHSRLREWIFGGFTQRILRDAEIPVLIAH